MKTLILIAGFLFVSALTAIRKLKGRKQLALLESGKMCVYCRSTNVTPGTLGVTCGACGQTTRWSLIKQPPLSADEIDKISAPDAKNPFRI